MKLITLIIGLILSLNLYASEDCQLEVVVNKDNVSWTSQNGAGKFLFIENLDTNLVYPQMITSANSGTLSLKLFEENKKGYRVVLGDITEQSKNMIDSHLLECYKKKDCSLSTKVVKVKKTKCAVLKSNTLVHE